MVQSKTTPRKKLVLEKAVEEIIQEASSQEKPSSETEPQGDFSKMVSTGSTLLDLAISGGRCEEGGIPGGIFAEVFGPEGWGKSALLCEVCASAQARGGEGVFLDVEGRIDREYSRIYGVDFRANNWRILGPEEVGTIEAFFSTIAGWNPVEGKALNVMAADSLAAMATVEELTAKGDKMAGMRRAARFSEGLRKVKTLVSQESRLLICSNQTRESVDEGGGGFGGSRDKPTGGKAIGFYASLRILVTPAYKAGTSSHQHIKISRTVGGNIRERIIGIRSRCKIVKSSVDVPYREVEVPIVFGLGIDDIRGNLDFIKEIKGAYEFCGKSSGMMDRAIEIVEVGGLEDQLKREMIALWREVEEKFRVERKRRVRQ